jgi:tRNA modification GTPase
MVDTQISLPDLDDTIVALSSAAGPAARAIVRLSGRRSAAIVEGIVTEWQRPRGDERRWQAGQVSLPGCTAPLDVDVFHFAAPQTYTGQDIVELHTLGCPPLVELLVARCLDSGARAAQPGEFTMRAFLAGKLDLTRAEAVLGVIEAGSRDELKHALGQLAGGMTQPLQELREDLLSLLADVEAALDFADEEHAFVSADELLRRLAKGLAYLTLMRRQLEQRALGQRPCRVVIAGPPNAGKSSLFNALLGSAAALVSPQPGTTRDYLEATLTADGMTLHLIDTAGLHSGGDELDLSAQQLGRDQAQEADILLWCSAIGEAYVAPPRWAGSRALGIATKCDLGAAPVGALPTSAVTGSGIDELRAALAQRA